MGQYCCYSGLALIVAAEHVSRWKDSINDTPATPIMESFYRIPLLAAITE
jgi:hypothetical protein